MSDTEKMTVSSDEDTSSSDDETSALEARASLLEAEIDRNSYLYDCHVELVDLYRKLADLKSMRAAYERFSRVFPLTPKIWLEWISDEIKYSDKAHVLALFEKAVKDYLSVDVWVEYVNYSMSKCEVKETYAIFERALNAVGLHFTQGFYVWVLLRGFESALLQQDECKEVLSEAWHQQIAKVYDVYKRQLAVPLEGMEKTYEQFQEWAAKLPEGNKIDAKSVDWVYNKALALLPTYSSFESRLKKAREEDLLDIYKEYINVVKDPSTVLCLFERAAAEISLNSAMWCDYCLYAMKLGDLAKEISKRALRNCPWNESLWVLKLRILEHLKCDDKDVMECFEEGLIAISPSPGLDLWLTYVEYVRRTADSKERLHKLLTQASEQLGELGDPSCRVLRLQARLYAKSGDMKSARSIWFQILNFSAFNGFASGWLEFIALEKQFGEARQLRKLYMRALKSCTDWPEYIGDDWIMYERECGSLEEVFSCLEKCSSIVKKDVESQAPKQKDRLETRKRTHEFNGNNSTNARKRFKPEKSEPLLPKLSLSDIDTSKSVFLSNMNQDINEERLKEIFPNATCIYLPKDRKGGSRCFAYAQFSTDDEVQQALTRDREPLDERPLFISECKVEEKERKPKLKYSENAEKQKLFVQNLPMHIKQSQLEEIFKPHNPAAVRLVTRPNGLSKGFAYIEFHTEEDASKALEATNDTTVHDRVINVAYSKPPPKKTAESFSFEPSRHARSRLQVPLVPRSIQKQATSSNDTLKAGNSEASSKSNADFRKMFFKN